MLCCLLVGHYLIPGTGWSNMQQPSFNGGILPYLALGGTFNPTKCCYKVHHRTPDKFSILCPSPPVPEEVAIHLDMHHVHQRMLLLAPIKGTHYLGIYVMQNGSKEPMENHLWKKAMLYMNAFLCTNMSH